MLADLHLHSCFSDGTRTPEEVAEALAAAGIGLAALADHNICAGYDRFRAACESLGIAALRGVELDCAYNGLVLHVLGYGFRPEGRIITLADHNRRLLLEMSRDLVKRMTADYPQLSLAEYDSWEYEPRKGGWKGLHYLLEKQVTERLTDGMGLYSRYGCDYSSYPFPSVKAVCEAVREAGGLPVLAHPANWFSSFSAQELAANLDALRDLGVGGIECFYPSHTPEMTSFCLSYCNRKHLLVTAGSDCHGDFNKRVRGVDYSIGTIRADTGQLSLGRLWNPPAAEQQKGSDTL